MTVDALSLNRQPSQSAASHDAEQPTDNTTTTKYTDGSFLKAACINEGDGPLRDLLLNKWTFVQRTTCSLDACYDRLSYFIFDRLVPTMIGVDSQLANKDILSLPLCCGGLGIVDSVVFVSKQYEWSRSICSHLQNGLRGGAVMVAQNKSSKSILLQ
ncbi:hypothetical protein GJ496_000831 [Pomphorhynchus laevis]|nr:hypothetical protein GJ496_000831 [Pomphorhynchus laevis]